MSSRRWSLTETDTLPTSSPIPCRAREVRPLEGVHEPLQLFVLVVGIDGDLVDEGVEVGVCFCGLGSKGLLGTGQGRCLWQGEGWWRQPRVALEELDQHIEASQAVLAGGLEVAADGAEGFGPGQCPEAAAYLVVQFGHPEVALALVIVKADGRVGPVPLHFVALVRNRHNKL